MVPFEKELFNPFIKIRYTSRFEHTSVPDVEHGPGLLRPPAVGRRDGAEVLSFVRLGHATESQAAGDDAARVAAAAASAPPLHRGPARTEVTLDDAVKL